jgi:hypothetical protein
MLPIEPTPGESLMQRNAERPTREIVPTISGVQSWIARRPDLPAAVRPSDGRSSTEEQLDMMMMTQLRKDLEYIEGDISDSLFTDIRAQMIAFPETHYGETHSSPSAERNLPNFPLSKGGRFPDFLEMPGDPSPLQNPEYRSTMRSKESSDASMFSGLAGLYDEIGTLTGLQEDDPDDSVTTEQVGNKSLLIVNFPLKADDNWLRQRFTEMGYKVSTVRGKSSGKNKKFPLGKNIFAFVNHKSTSSAKAMKKACDEGQVELPYHDGKVWIVRAYWAVESRSS